MNFKSALLAVVGASSTSRDRERLRAAKAAQVQAARDIEAPAAVVAHIEAVINEWASKDCRAIEAEAEAKTALSEWSREGSDRERLAAAAVEARRMADHALITAEAARKDLSGAQYDLKEAQNRLRACEEPIADANGLQLVDVLAPTLTRVDELLAELVPALIKVEGARRVVAPHFSEDKTHRSPSAARILYDTMKRAEDATKLLSDYAYSNTGTILRTPPAEVLKAAQECRELAAQLLRDA